MWRIELDSQRRTGRGGQKSKPEGDPQVVYHVGTGTVAHLPGEFTRPVIQPVGNMRHLTTRGASSSTRHVVGNGAFGSTDRLGQFGDGRSAVEDEVE